MLRTITFLILFPIIGFGQQAYKIESTIVDSTGEYESLHYNHIKRLLSECEGYATDSFFYVLNERNEEDLLFAKEKAFFKKSYDKRSGENTIKRESPPRPMEGPELQYEATGKTKLVNGYLCHEYLITLPKQPNDNKLFYVSHELPFVNQLLMNIELPGMIMEYSIGSKGRSGNQGSFIVQNKIETVSLPYRVKKYLNEIRSNPLLSYKLLNPIDSTTSIPLDIVEKINQYIIRPDSLKHPLEYFVRQDFMRSDIQRMELFKGSDKLSFKAVRKNETDWFVVDRDTVLLKTNLDGSMESLYYNSFYMLGSDTLCKRNNWKDKCYRYDSQNNSIQEFFIANTDEGLAMETGSVKYYNDDNLIFENDLVEYGIVRYYYDDQNRLIDMHEMRRDRHQNTEYGPNGLVTKHGWRGTEAIYTYDINILDEGGFEVYTKITKDDEDLGFRESLYYRRFNHKLDLIEQKDTYNFSGGLRYVYEYLD